MPRPSNRPLFIMGGKIKHGLRYTRLYHIHSGMKNRCYNENDKDYKNYGARGIKICDEWLDVSVFYAWAMTHGYADNLTIDRVDVNKDYCPENCRWATPKQQQNNRRINRLITYKGETHNVREWSEKLGVPYQTIYARLQRGESPDVLFGGLKCERREYTYEGETHSLKEWARLKGIKYGTLYNRVVLSNWSFEEAIRAPAFIGHNQFS